MSRDDCTPRGLSDPESHLDLAAAHRQQPQVDLDAGPRPVAPTSAHQGQHVTLNAALEVDMLRHKLRALETIIERHGVFRPASLYLPTYLPSALALFLGISSSTPVHPLAHILIMVSLRRHRVTHSLSL